jgi:hypothetical protein
MGCIVELIAFLLPGFLLGLIFDTWGVYISIGAFGFFTLLGLILFPNKMVDQQTKFIVSKNWTYSFFWIVGSLLAQLV